MLIKEIPILPVAMLAGVTWPATVPVLIKEILPALTGVSLRRLVVLIMVLMVILAVILFPAFVFS